MTSSKVVLQPMEIIDLPIVAKLEQESYPPDEAASAITLEYRISMAPELCYIALERGSQQISGFVVGTAAPNDTPNMTEDMMRDHYPSGNILCIHSVVVEESRRRQGFGTAMLNAYIQKIVRNTEIKRILLLSKARLIPFYESVGFEVMGESSIVHGQEKWFELCQDIR